MDLRNVKKGDQVESVLRGIGVVYCIDAFYEPYPVHVRFDHSEGEFNLDGKMHHFHKYPEIVRVIPREEKS